MNTTDTTTHDQTGTPDQEKFSALDRGAVAFGAILIPVMYAIILAAGLITLGLVEIRQVNMVNFNALIANLEQRDRAKAEIPVVLARVRKQHKRYDDMIARSVDCFSVAGTILGYEHNNREAVTWKTKKCRYLVATFKARCVITRTISYSWRIMKDSNWPTRTRII